MIWKSGGQKRHSRQFVLKIGFVPGKNGDTCVGQRSGRRCEPGLVVGTKQHERINL